VEFASVNCPNSFRVNDCHIGSTAFSQSPAIKPQDMTRFGAHGFNQAHDRKVRFVHQFCPQNTNCGLQTDNSEWGIVKGRFLFLNGMGRMVGGNAIDYAFN
jgi:hypothetical protein